MNGNPISSTAVSVQMAYQYYIEKKFIVNRKYQRKLVWTMEEKAAFIDSLQKFYSVPLFLFANKNIEEATSYEIIDGMQRLNAIMAFIENEYPIKASDGEYRYFDLETLSSTKSAMDNGKIIQRTPKLERQLCVNITNYPLPFSFISADEKSIEDIFRRINSYGRQLSNQEIRQAGAIGLFPELVRKVACTIRGDVSPHDQLKLNEMKLISLSNKRLDYGIVMEDIYWVKQHIITIQNMRVSRDEELIAWILSYMIMGEQMSPTSYTLNKLYKYAVSDNDNLSTRIEAQIEHLGSDTIHQWFSSIHSLIIEILNHAKKDFRTLVFSDEYSEGLVRTYQVIFLAFFELTIKENMYASNKLLLINKLDKIAKNHLIGISKSNWDAKDRFEKIQSIKGIIKCCFKEATGNNVLNENWTLELDNLLRLSRIEGSQYDFKSGFHDLIDNSKFNTKLVLKIIEILTAEVNKGPQTHGYVIVGLTEGEKDFERFKKHYNTSNGELFTGTDFYVTGVEEEIKKYYGGDGDKLQNDILKTIKSTNAIDETVKNYITQHFRMVKYKEHDIIVFQLKSENDPILYNDTIYVRKGNNTEAVTGASTIKNFYLNIFKNK